MQTKLEIPVTVIYKSFVTLEGCLLRLTTSDFQLDYQNSLLLSLPYQEFLFHAISSDSSLYKDPCLYCMVQQDILEQFQKVIEVPQQVIEENEEEANTLLIIPNQQEFLSNLFDIFCDCSSINPSEDLPELDFAYDLSNQLQGNEDEQFRDVKKQKVENSQIKIQYSNSFKYIFPFLSFQSKFTQSLDTTIKQLLGSNGISQYMLIQNTFINPSKDSCKGKKQFGSNLYYLEMRFEQII